jgi:two-component system chemotaxis response regulator CheY
MEELKMRKNTRIAVVDDQPTLGKELANIFINLEFTDVKYFSSPKTAWETFLAEARFGQPYELIFLDINMPVMKGTELLKLLRSTDTYKTTPIFMTTTESEKETVIMCIVLGATDYLVKPYTTAVLLDKIKGKVK